MNINIVDILNTGVTGFAFLMLYLGYRLTSVVQFKIFEQKIDDFKDIEMYREWKKLVLSQMLNTRYFLLFSLVFFICGLLLLIYKAESKIFLYVSSADEKIYSPSVYHQGKKLTSKME